MGMNDVIFEKPFRNIPQSSQFSIELVNVK